MATVTTIEAEGDLEVEDQVDLEEARWALEEAEREGTISLAELKRELDL